MADFNLFDALFKSDRDERVALLYEQRAITYGALRGEVVHAAEVLSALGISTGDRVGVLLHDSPEFIASFVAVISLGAIAVPINMGLNAEAQQVILKDCGARLAIVEGETCPSLFENSTAAADEFDTSVPFALWERARDRGPTIPESRRDKSFSPALKDLLIVRRGNGVSSSVAGLRTQSWENAMRRPLTQNFPVRLDVDSPAFILYTSGSTGEPKGAIHTQGHIDYTNQTYCAEVLQLRDDDRLFSSSRLPFAYGLGNAFTFPLLNGCTSILCREKPLPELIADVFRERRPTIFFGVPVAYRMLLDHHRSVGALDCSSLRVCVSAGEALPANLGEEWQKTFSVEVLDGIGSTEMLHMFFSNHESQVLYGSSGTLLRGYEAKLIDHEGSPTPDGEVGNLWIRGASAANGYWQRPETTAETFVDGWVRTGDLYRRDGEGYWWHMGRSDDCFKPTGQWVSPVEVESVLLRHDNVGRAAVVEGFDDAGLSCVCAFVVLSDNGLEVGDAEKQLRARCEDALPRFKRPRHYIFVSELPYTATGKIQRFKLREQLRRRRAAG
jgi:benzoate-CoA ligase family protein